VVHEAHNVFVDVDVIRRLREIAKRENCAVSEIIRKALNEFVSRREREKLPLALIGAGQSGRKDVPERNEEFLGKGFGR